MSEQPVFTSMPEKLRYFADRKFGKLHPVLNSPTRFKPTITNKQVDSIGKQAHYAGLNYPFTPTKNEAVAIPYFSNEISKTEVIKEPKYTVRNDHPLSLRTILEGLMAAVLNLSVEDFKRTVNVGSLLLELPYPLTTKLDNETALMNFSSSATKDEYSRISITDPIIYAMVLDYSRYVISNSQKTLFILGTDIIREHAQIERPTFDAYFITLLKSFFATTLLGRETDELKLLSFPSYSFSLGTYHSEFIKYNNKIVMVQTSHTLLHVLPLWSNVFYDSFLIQLTSLSFQFSYRQGTLFRHFEHTIPTDHLPQVSTRLQDSVLVPMRVSLSETADDVTPYDVYTANLRVRNTIASHLDNVTNFNAVKDKMYPKGREGAKTKLLGLLTRIDISKLKTVLELGAAPGTWTQTLMAMDAFSKIDSVTSVGGSALTMYPNVLKAIGASPVTTLYHEDATKYLSMRKEKYDFILSDIAMKHDSYADQSLSHDVLYSGLLHGILSRLAHNGTVLFKMYDLTPHMHELLSALSTAFLTFEIVKPNGSCPTNPEVYVIAQGYNEYIKATHNNLVPTFNMLLTNQIAHLNRLVTTGFNIHISYTLSYPSNRLRFSDVTELPYNLIPCLQSLKFSEYFYPANLTGSIYDETTLLGDKYLRFRWDLPQHPYPNQIYMTETSVGYESNGVALQNVFTVHRGFVVEHGIMKHFFVVDKEASCIFSPLYAQTCVTTDYSCNLPDNQFILSKLLASDTFKSRFENVISFDQLVVCIQHLSLKAYLDLQTEWSINASKLTINQFFRDSQALHLYYSKINLYTSVTTCKTTGPVAKLNLTQVQDRRTFNEKFKAYNTRHTSKESFRLLLNEYTILYREDELLKTSICTTERSYIEYSSGQICVSQPACVQLRRSLYVH